MKKYLILVLFIFILIVLAAGAFFIMQKNNIPTATQKNAGIVNGFPNFPTYPNTKIDSSQINPFGSDNKKSYQEYLTSSDDVITIINWYTDNLKQNEWNIDRANDPSQIDDQNIAVSNQKYNATVNVEKELGEETNISVFIKEK